MRISWGERERIPGGGRYTVRADDRRLTVFTEAKDGTASATIDGNEWTFSRDKQKAIATDGNVTFEAHGEAPFEKAKLIHANFNLRDIELINEQKSDWIMDENDTKIAQFTGANHGVRHVEVDVEPGAELDDAEMVFLSWLARVALEERMVAMTWIVTLALIFLTPFTLFLFLF